MKIRAAFVIGAVIGLLAGSRIGPELYKRVASAAASLAENPKVRRGASSAGDRAASVAKAAGSSAANQVKHASNVVAHRFGERHDGVEQSSAANGSVGPTD
jgi:hypothetical protein